MTQAAANMAVPLPPGGEDADLPACGKQAGTRTCLPAASRQGRGDASSGPPPAGWVTAARAGQIMGLSTWAVRDRCRAGMLPARKCADAQGAAMWYVDPTRVPALMILAGDLAAPVPADSTLAGLTESQRRGAMDRMVIVEQYLAARRQAALGGRVWQFTAQWCAGWSALHGHAVTRPSLMRWVAAYGRDGLAGLTDRRGRPPGREFSPEAMAFIESQYMDENGPTVSVCWERANALAPARGWAMPCLRTARTWIARHTDPKLLALGRDPKRFRDRCVPDVHRDWSQVPAMALWVGDHRRLDVMVPHPVQIADKKAVGGKRTVYQWHRPWLTLWIDARTWKPVGRRIRFDDPDTQVIMSAFIDGVERYGKPDGVLIDNGKDFRGRRFAGGRGNKTRSEDLPACGQQAEIMDPASTGNMLQALRITPHFALPYNSKSKPIEPWFRIMSERFDKCFESYIGNREDRKPERFDLAHHPARERLHALRNRAEEFYRNGLTLEAVTAAWDKWVAEDYCHRECPIAASKGLTVDDAFQKLRDPAFRLTRPASQDLAMLLMPSQAVVVSKDGVWCHAFSCYYWAEELEPLRCCSGRDKARHVVYRWVEGDPSRIFVFSARNGAFLAVARPAPGQGIHPLAAPGSPDAEDLAEAMRHKRHCAKQSRQALADLKGRGHELLLEAQRRGGRMDAGKIDAETRGRGDAESTATGLPAAGASESPCLRVSASPRLPASASPRLPSAASPRLPSVVPLLGAVSQAAEAGRIEQRRHEADERRSSARDFFASQSATGTDDSAPTAAQSPSTLEILAASPAETEEKESP